MSSTQQSGWNSERVVTAAIGGSALANMSILALVLFGHGWILNADKPTPVDFLAFWATGQTALAGNASAAYNPDVLHVAQVAIAGYSFPGDFFWNYPPPFLLIAMLLASAPYAASFLTWVVVTWTAYAVAIGVITRRSEGTLYACASPVVLMTAFVGQTGFLTTALLGGFLLSLPRRPILGGLLLGLLAYKPQFGVLIPVALVAGRHWRSLFSGTATVAFLIVASAFAFGWSTYASFLHSLPVVSHAYLTLGGEGWAKMQSIYSIARDLGLADSPAWLAQIACTVFFAAAIAILWRSGAAYELKAAALTVGVMLSTPYLHIYDFPVLLVALAFLYRHRPFDRFEWIAAVASNLLTLVFLAQLAPIGPGLILIVCALIFRRIIGPAASLRAEILPAAS